MSIGWAVLLPLETLAVPSLRKEEDPKFGPWEDLSTARKS